VRRKQTRDEHATQNTDDFHRRRDKKAGSPHTEERQTIILNGRCCRVRRGLLVRCRSPDLYSSPSLHARRSLLRLFLTGADVPLSFHVKVASQGAAKKLLPKARPNRLGGPICHNTQDDLRKSRHKGCAVKRWPAGKGLLGWRDCSARVVPPTLQSRRLHALFLQLRV